VNSESAAAAVAALEHYMAVFNARDVAAFEGAFNLPAVRAGVGHIDKVEAGSHGADYFSVGALETWDHSTAEDMRVIHAGEDAAHISTRITRYQKGGGMIGQYDVVYFLTREAGHWGVKAHSGVAVASA